MATRFLLDKRAAQITALLSTAGPDDLLLSTPEAAMLLGVSAQWLELGRVQSYGPVFVALSPRSVKYSLRSLRAFIAERTTTTTNSAVAGPGRPPKAKQRS